MTTNIYILRLLNNKWYVGKSDDVDFRYQQHLKGYGSTWTKIYKPISIERIISNASPFDEDKITKEYMSKYGIDNVRGGSYCNKDLDEFQTHMLKTEIWSAKDRCARCGRNGHYQQNCYANTDVDGNEFCSEDEEEYTVVCYRCGRIGHISPDCYARTHANGYYIR
jgi:predicted GIY-YIG superfamily endonuclease